MVVEAPEKSGALITARRRLEQGRDVMAVPGASSAAATAAATCLMRDGAKLVESADDILLEMELGRRRRADGLGGAAESPEVVEFTVDEVAQRDWRAAAGGRWRGCLNWSWPAKFNGLDPAGSCGSSRVLT